MDKDKDTCNNGEGAYGYSGTIDKREDGYHRQILVRMSPGRGDARISVSSTKLGRL